MKIGITICFVMVSFFGLSQSSELSTLSQSLDKDDISSFWNQACKIVDTWTKTASLNAQNEVNEEEKSVNPLRQEAKSSSEFMGNLGTGSSRQSKHDLSVKNKEDREIKENLEKKQSMLNAMNNLMQRKATGDSKLMLTLMEEYLKL